MYLKFINIGDIKNKVKLMRSFIIFVEPYMIYLTNIIKIYMYIYLFHIGRTFGKPANKKSYGKCPTDKNATVTFLSGREYGQ